MPIADAPRRALLHREIRTLAKLTNALPVSLALAIGAACRERDRRSSMDDSDGDETMSGGLLQLSPDGGHALAQALSKLPSDLQNPVPLCERIAQLLDVVVPLTTRADLSEADRAILRAFCTSDRRLLAFAALTSALDAAVVRSAAALLAPVTIHVLDDGLPLCRFSLRPPVYWPAGHIWVRPEQYEENAAACNDPEHELHSILPYTMCDACGRAMVDPPLDAGGPS